MKTYDVGWYEKNVADPVTGAQKRFTGGELRAIDFELDAYWYGVQFENARRRMRHTLFAVFTLIKLMSGDEFATGPGLELLDTTAWLQHFDALWDSHNIPDYLDPSDAVNFRLDVLRAMATLPKSYRRALTHAMDGYDLEEIADFMGWTTKFEIVHPLTGQAHPFVDPGTVLEVPNEESSERVIRKASSQVRSRCSLGVRSKPRPPDPAPERLWKGGDYTTNVIALVEEEIEQTRAWRRRELRRRASRRKAA